MPEVKGFDQLQVHYHVGLCSEAGFLHVKEFPNSSGCWKMYQIINLSWQGHEALDKLKAGADFRDLNNPTYSAVLFSTLDVRGVVRARPSCYFWGK